MTIWDNVQPKPDAYFAFRFDGSQGAVDDFNERTEGSAYSALWVDVNTCVVQFNGGFEWSLASGGVGVYVQRADGQVVVQGYFANLALAEALYTLSES